MEAILIALLGLGAIAFLLFLSDGVHDASSTKTAAGRPPTSLPETERTTSAHRTGDNTFDDPKDTPYYLAQRGWKRVSDDSDRWRGQYRAGGKTMNGGLERTPGGRRKFYVHDPPRVFVRRAERGRCLANRPHLADNVYEVHFTSPPDSFGDGIDHIEAMLGGKT